MRTIYSSSISSYEETVVDLTRLTISWLVGLIIEHDAVGREKRGKCSNLWQDLH